MQRTSLPNRSLRSSSGMSLTTIAIAAMLAAQATATDYHVGPGQLFGKLSQVPFNNLQPGDTVYIHAKPGGYHENFQLMNSGTAQKPISVIGVKDGILGAMPVIDGSNCVFGPSVDQGAFTNFDYRGGVIIGPPKNYVYGQCPSYIVIDGLEVCNFNWKNVYTPLKGGKDNFDQFTSGIYCERVKHLTVKNCYMHDNGLGLFINSKYGDKALSEDILVSGNRFVANGNVGTYSEHHLYTETGGITIEHNYFGPMLAGSHGANIKDRSAGTVIRYNSMFISPSNLGVALLGAQSDGQDSGIVKLPSYTKTYFYGNTMYNPAAGSDTFILYGGDLGAAQYLADSRKGTLYAYNNTFVNVADGNGPTHRNGCRIFRLPSLAESGGLPIQEKVECWNNIAVSVNATAGHTPGELYWLHAGNGASISFGPNPGVPQVRQNVASPTVQIYKAAEVGSNANVTGQLPWNDLGHQPVFVSMANLDFRLANNTLLGMSMTIPGLPPSMDVTRQMVGKTAWIARPTPAAFGAFEPVKNP